MRIKRVNENLEEEINQFMDSGEDTNGVFETGIFNDIEGDLENMSDDEKHDYLLSIIAFCNQHLKSLEQ